MNKDSARINHYGALMGKIAEFRTDNKKCNITIHIKDRTFKCHSLILSAASKYFDRMFGGEFKENSENEVTLHEVEADLFANVLRFVYEGDVEAINSSNIYDYIRVADFYELPTLEEFCVTFVRENLNEIANDVLKIFSFAHNAAKKNLVELLSRHIHDFFYYFYKTPEFYGLSIDQVEKVLIVDGREPILPDVLHDGINEWIDHQVDSAAVKKEWCDKLYNKIDFDNMSWEYLRRYLRDECDKRRKASSESVSNDKASATDGIDVEKLPMILYAYISRRSEGRPSTNTSIFSLRSTLGSFAKFPLCSWVDWGEQKHAYDFMRTIVVDRNRYSLGYLKNHPQDPQQTFTSGASLLMYPCTSLKPPPLILDDFDMCGTRDYIYVYNKKPFFTSESTFQMCAASTFSEGQLSHGMYMYKRDADEWLPLPYPRMRFDDACMTCDKKRVYLIGGSNSRGFVQAYDIRTQGWSALYSTTGIYERAACSVAGGNLYVAGGRQNPKCVEMYDRVSGKWQQKAMLPEKRYDGHTLFKWKVGCILQTIVSFSNRVSRRSNILVYNPMEDGGNKVISWIPIKPHILDGVKYKKRTPTDEINILDMVGF